MNIVSTSSSSKKNPQKNNGKTKEKKEKKKTKRRKGTPSLHHAVVLQRTNVSNDIEDRTSMQLKQKAFQEGGTSMQSVSIRREGQDYLGRVCKRYVENLSASRLRESEVEKRRR